MTINKVVIASVLFAFSLLLYGCNSSGNSSYPDYDSNIPIDDYDYEDEEPVTSDNWSCTEDCSGHEAGYEWASEQGITDPDDCGGNSDSFIEGCEAYANEYQMEDEDYYEGY